MYPASADYLLALNNNARADTIRGTINGVSFAANNVVKGSFSVSNQLCPATKIELGGVYIGELDLTFTSAFASTVSARGTWRGLTLTAEIGVELADTTFEYIPIGVYTVESAKWTDSGLQIVSYDNMMLLDKNVNITTSSGGLYDWLNYICTECGITLGMTQLEVSQLPNGSETLVLGEGNPIETYRDMLSQLAVVACCFATVNRDGELVLRKLPDYGGAHLVVPAKLRYSTTFSDYTSYYTSLDITDNEEGSVATYSNTNIGGLTLDIGANPFLQVGILETKDRQRQAIIDALTNFRSVPFSVSVLPNPALDLGDLLEFTGGYGSGARGAVMSYTFKCGVTTVEGYGENPAATSVASSTDKAINQVRKQDEKNNIIYYTFANVSTLTITNVPTKLYEVEFMTTDQTTINIEHEFKMLNDIVGGEQTVTLYYYVNGDQVNYEPADTYSEDNKYHLLNGFYTLLNVTGGAITNWEVWAKTDAGTATIDVGDLHAKLWGQKLYAEEGGQIPDLDDSITLEPMPNPIPIGMSETVELETDVPVGNYLDLHNGTYLELHDGTGLELHDGGN